MHACTAVCAYRYMRDYRALVAVLLLLRLATNNRDCCGGGVWNVGRYVCLWKLLVMMPTLWRRPSSECRAIPNIQRPNTKQHSKRAFLITNSLGTSECRAIPNIQRPTTTKQQSKRPFLIKNSLCLTTPPHPEACSFARLDVLSQPRA